MISCHFVCSSLWCPVSVWHLVPIKLVSPVSFEGLASCPNQIRRHKDQPASSGIPLRDKSVSRRPTNTKTERPSSGIPLQDKSASRRPKNLVIQKPHIHQVWQPPSRAIGSELYQTCLAVTSGISAGPHTSRAIEFTRSRVVCWLMEHISTRVDMSVPWRAPCPSSSEMTVASFAREGEQ